MSKKLDYIERREIEKYVEKLSQYKGRHSSLTTLYVPHDKKENLQDGLLDTEFQMGALKSKGFGKCKVARIESKECEIKQGNLKVKLFESEIEEFGIELITPVYGYLFKPDEFSIGGVYRRALFPGSLANAPEVLLKEVMYYDK